MSARLLAGFALLTVAAAAPSQTPAPPADDHPVIELRQYKIVHGQRDPFIDLFEQRFIESQEAVGATLIGQFRDRDDPDRFVWIRGFDGMAARGRALNAFYFGPVWQQYRGTANPMLDDNDNVLLLRPAAPGSGFDSVGKRAAPGQAPPRGGMVVATIHYLWKDPTTGFAAYFRDRLSPALARAGLPVIASYVPERAANTFLRLPVRQGEKVFVWFTRVADAAAYRQARAQLAAEPAWRGGLAATLADFEERPAQVLQLDPTPRSALR